MKKVKGFTLLELTVAIVVIGIISVGSFEFFRYCKHYIVDSELRLKAVNLARETMEKFYDQLNPISDSDPLPIEEEFSIINGHRYYSVIDGHTGDYKILTVTVEWNI